MKEIKVAVIAHGLGMSRGYSGGVIQGSFVNCNISLGLDLFNEGIIEYI